MTGNIGRPGTGANSITGQCNAMGSRLFSNTTNLLGGRDFTDAGAPRRGGRRCSGIDVDRIPDQPSLAYDQIIEGIHRGTIKGLWVIATNTAHSWINQTDVRELLDQLDFLVVQDMYATTETAQQADLVLPAAGWGEKEGTFINSERRIGRHQAGARGRRARPWPTSPSSSSSPRRGAAATCSREWDDARGRVRDPRPAVGRAAVRHLRHRRATPISTRGGVQWPFPEPVPRPDRRAGVAGDGTRRRRAAAVRRRPVLHPRRSGPVHRRRPGPGHRAAVGPLPARRCSPVGARRAQWHTGTRTVEVGGAAHAGPAVAPTSRSPPTTPRALGIEASEWVVVESARGSMRARACVTADGARRARCSSPCTTPRPTG